jgi:hypothetical protein
MSRLGIIDSFGQGLRRTAEKYIDNINPIRMFNMQQGHKLRADLGGSYSRRVGPAMLGRTTRARAGRQSVPTGKRIQAYFNGYNMDDLSGLPEHGNMMSMSRMERAGSRGHSLYAKVAAKRAGVRRVSAGILGAATVGTMVFGRDNLVSEAGISGVSLGGVGLASAGIAELGHRSGHGRAGAMGAAALVGWTALNMYRSGDNWGPM